MSVNFTQYCILGVVYEEKDIKVVIKQKDYHYKIGDWENEGLYELGEDIAYRLGLQCVVDGDKDLSLYLGYALGETEDYGRVDLLLGSEDLDELVKKKEELKELFPDKDIELHFVTSIG